MTTMSPDGKPVHIIIPGILPAPGVDREDSLETLTRINAARATGTPDSRIHLLDGHDRIIHDAGTGATGDLSGFIHAGNPAVSIGGYPRGGIVQDICWPTENRLTSHYHDDPVFQAHAGRRVTVLSPDPHTGELDRDLLNRTIAEFNCPVHAKIVGPKMPLLTCDFSDPDNTSSEFSEWFWYSQTHSVNDIMISETIPMTREYRCFIDTTVGVVTSAACIEAHTPVDRDADTVNLLETVRGSGEFVTEPDTVTGYITTGNRIAEELLSTVGAQKLIVDLATNARTGDTVIVEYNRPENAGFYASEPVDFFAGIITDLAADRRNYLRPFNRKEATNV